MESWYTNTVRSKFSDIIYEHVCYEFPDIEKYQVERVLDLSGYDVSPINVIYIQNVANGWKQMLHTAEINNQLSCISIDELCLYNKICMGNMYSGAGQIRYKSIGKSGSKSAKFGYGSVFNAMYDGEIGSIDERACNLYCDILEARMFDHGNECVARLATNLYLMINRHGYFTISEKIAPIIKKRVDSMLSRGTRKQLCNYLAHHAIIGG